MSNSNSTNKYPSKTRIISALKEANGVFRYAASSLGYHENSLRNHIKKEGFWPEVEAIRNTILGQQAENVNKISQLDILSEKVKEYEAALKSARKENIIEERIASRLENVVPRLSPRYEPAHLSDKEELDEHEFVLLFSDTHAGEVVDPDQTLGMNEYNWEIMLGRMAKLQKSVLAYQRNRPYKISKLHVCMLGDMLSGDIHQELEVTNELPHEEATVQFGYDCAKFIEEFVPHFEKINVVGVPGNHPRRSKKPSMKQAQNNSDYVSYRFMQALLKEYESISWDIPRSAYANLTVAERWHLLLMHGDGIRTTMPGVPWGGVVRRITTLEQQFNAAKQPIDYVALGHFHTANALDGVGVKTFMNGSVKGLDEYSLRQFGSGRNPSQLLLTFHPRNGITDISYIDLEPNHPSWTR